MIFRVFLICCLWCFAGQQAFAKLNILTTTTDLKSIVEEVGGDEVAVEALCRGTQDPHYLEAKPSYMLKANKADLVVANGLGLEAAWLPKVLAGGRNPNVMPGQNGYFEVGQLVEVIEVPTGRVSRADGDVHPEGNPHITLDPIRVGLIAVGVAQKLSALDTKHAADYQKRALLFKEKLEAKTQDWQKIISDSGVKQIVTYHKMLSYFLKRFKLETAAVLEPFPGVPPTAKHVLQIIKTSNEKGVHLILVENFFDDAVAKRVAQDVKPVRVVSVPVSVEGRADIKNLEALYENLVRVIQGEQKSLKAQK